MTDAARSSSRMGWLPLGPLGARRRSSDQESTGSGSPAQPRGRLFRKYVLLIVGLVSLVLLLNSAFDFWFSYEENKAALFRIQQEKAASAARRIEQFVDEIERQLGWTTAPQWAAAPLEQRRFDYVRLLRQVPPITELIQLDDNGKEQLKVSRLAMDVVGSEKDYSQSPSFTEARKHRVWFSPVYFRKESEPYMTMAMARTGRNAGVTVAEVNLKLIWDVITGLKIGQSGYAYVVDRDGRLIAHPDISLVLRNTDLANLPQVAAAHAEASGEKAASPGAMVAKGINGNSVLTAHAAIAPLGWTVFVELPLSEALAPLYGSALRTAGLLALALVLATSAALLLARRMTVPIRQLQAGAARIGAGELDRRIEIHTGDELEGLAGEFNRMAADLQSSYADLEKKVEDRTTELKEALEQQTATAEVLGVINSSPGDLAPVFDATLEKALTLCDASFGQLMTFDGVSFRAAAWRGYEPGPNATTPTPGMALYELVHGEQVIHIPDITADDVYRSGNAVRRRLADQYGARTAIWVALKKDSALLGAFVIYRTEVRPFTDKQIALLQNFAAQAVIAMENARLITETREALEQQTATAEVLGVINSSPGDLVPVFQSIVEKAHTLCGAACGSLQLWDGEKFRGVAMRGFSEAMVERLRLGYSPSDMPCQRVVDGERVVHCVDLAEIESPVAREGGVKLGGVRTILYVALRKDDVLLGQIVAARQEVRPFSEKEIALVESFAAQAVIAMENARLITETREALEQQTATAEVLQVINSSPGDLAPVFNAILEKARGLCGAAQGALVTYDGEHFRAVATHGQTAEFAERLSQPFRPAPGGPQQRLLRGARLVHVPDVSVFADADPVGRAAIEGGIRTLLMLPLRKDDVLLGYIAANRLEVRPFSDKQIALLENFAAQAVIAMENARLITETREALEQQTATAEVLGVINSSPGDLAPVFDAMLERASRLCDAAFGVLWRIEGDQVRCAALHGVPEAYRSFLEHEGSSPGPGSAVARTIRERSLIHFTDAAAGEPYRSGDPFAVAAVELGGVRTLVNAPLVKDEAVLGIFGIYRQEVRPFSDKQIALLQNFAAQAVIAMENARLITETREALEQQTATAEVLGVINSSPGDLAPVFDAMLEKATRLSEAAFGMLLTWDGECFHRVAWRGASPELMDALGESNKPAPGSLAYRIVRGESVISVADLLEEEAYIAGAPVRALARIGGARSFVTVALRKDDRLLGVFSIYRREVRPFSDKQIALLQNFAAQAVIAMENARLITETREALEQQTATAEVLQVINASPGDLAPVFNVILEKAHTLCGAAHGSLQLYDGETLHAVATHAVSDKFAEILRQGYRAADSPASRALIEGKRFAHIADCAEIDHPVFRSAAELAGIRAVLFVPLRRDNEFLGLISAARLEVRPFSEKQIALLQNFAAQAVIAMENARLITETREALEQQTATAEVLGVINSSPGDLAPVFDAMLEKATRLCEAPFGILRTWDGERFHFGAVHGDPRFCDWVRQRGPIRPDRDDSLLGRIEKGELVVRFADARDEGLTTSPGFREMVEASGIRSAVTVALHKDDALLGIITVYRQEVRPFSGKQIALLQNFAAQAVIAMENARLITETREALEQQTATAEVLQVINSSPGDLAPVFDAMLERAMRLCEAAFGLLTKFDGEQFHALALRGPMAFTESWREPRLPTPGLALHRLAHGEDLVQIEDVTEDDAYRTGNPIRRALADLGGARSALWVALRKDDALVGAFVIYRQEVRLFTPKHIELIRTFAAQAVIAMENARLITETREALEQQTATAEVLGVINSSPGDLAPVFEAMLDKAMRLCNAAFGYLMTYDGERFQEVAHQGLPPRFAEYLPRMDQPGPSGAYARIKGGAPLVHIADLKEGDVYRTSPLRRALVDLGGARTGIIVALRKDEALLGVLTIYRQEVRQFSDKQIALLQNFAAQAVIAMENARLITETREALEQQTATAEVLGVINNSPGDLAPVFEAMLDKAMHLCDAAFGTLWTYDGACVHAVALHNVPPVFAEFLTRAPHQVGPDSAHGRLLRGEPVVHIPDIVAEKAYQLGDPIRRALVELGGGRTLLAVPLRKDDRFLGDFVIYRQEARLFSDKQIALLENFAAQAVIAMENARLITETREALEQQTATAEVLGVINSSPGDLAPVFDAMLEKATHLCEASFGVLCTYDGASFRATALRGVPAAYARFLTAGPLQPGPGNGLARVAAGEKVVHVLDVAAEDTYRSGEALRRALADLGGARTTLTVALPKDDALLGAFIIYRREVRPFTEKQIALVQNFAAQAVIAMENVRLITELRESLEYQTATSDVLRVVSRSAFDLDTVLQTVVTTAIRLCRADSAVIYRNDDGQYGWAAGHMLSPEYEQIERNVRIPPGTGTVVGRAALEGATVQILDAWTDPLYEAKNDARVGGVHTMIGVPLLREGAPIGVIGLARRRVEAFSEREIQLVTTFADQAVIAIENARLITELRQRTRDLQESLEYQTATSDVLKVVSRSTFDLQPVLDTLVNTAARLCSADLGHLTLRDGQVYRVAASFAFSDEWDAFIRRQTLTADRGSVVGRSLLEARAVHIADITTDPEYAVPEAITIGNIRTLIGVPLLRENEPIGVFAFGRSRVEPFTERQIALVSTFADQAVIAIENARLFNELRQRTHDLQELLEYQTASSDVLKVISRSGAELGPVLDTLVETAARICRADSGFIFRLQDGLCRMAAAFGIPEEYKDFQQRNPITPSRGTLAGRTVLERSAVHIEDAATDPEYTRAEAVQLGRQRTILGVPLIREDALIGVITLARSHVEPFNDKQIGLVTTFADQAVIAIENARLFGELRARTEELGSSVAELKMLSEVGQAVSSTLDLRAVLSTILNASLGVTWANAGAIFRYIRAERAFRLVEAVGWDDPLLRSVRDLRVEEAETAMGEAAARRTPIQLAELAERPSAPLRDASLAAGFHSALIVPLVGAERILGAIILMRQEAGEFPAETVRLMQTLASQSVLAIQNARLFREIADKSEQLALASQHKSQFLANMSHELRTPLNAILGYAELLVDGIYGVLPDRPKGVLERIQNNGKHLLALINDVLDLAKIEAGQLTLTLEDYTLPEVVKSVVTATEPLATAKGLKFTAAVQDDLPMAHGDARRVSQVLLNLVGNAIKFTDEGEVEIRASLDKGQFVLTVRDTGPGIPDADQERIFGEFQQIDNTNTRKKGGTGLGLAISKRMVEMQGGTISVDSILGQGSTFRVVLPVHVDEMMEAA